MPDETEKTPEQIEAEKREADAVAARAAAPQPEYISRDAFVEFQRQQDEKFERLITTLAPRQEQKQEPVVNYDSEIQKAEEEGNTARATELRIAKATAPLQKRIQDFEQFGVTQLESISSEVALQDADDRKLYQRFKKEVDTVRAGMPPQFRTSPESLRTALTFVKGQHLDTLIKERSEALAREVVGRKDTTGVTPSSTESNRGKKPDRLPTPEEYFNDEAKIAQVEAMGGPDKFAQKVSGGRNKTWAEWVEKGLKIMGKPVPEKKAS